VSDLLTKSAMERLVKPLPSPLGKLVSRIMVSVSPDHDGIDSLFFRVVLKDDPQLTSPSRELGDRLRQISSELRRRAAMQGRGFAYVNFVAESELRQLKRKTA
jgi:hypothetical protein